MRTYHEINDIKYGFFICPSMTLGNNLYYGLVFDFSSCKPLQNSSAFKTMEEVEIWLKKKYQEIAKEKI